MDGQARQAQKSLFADLEIPRSHLLFTDIESIDRTPDLPGLLQESGFDRIKIKMGRNLVHEKELLEKIAARSSLKLRLDFNGKLSASLFGEFLSTLSPTLTDAIDFFEDPIPWNLEQWRAVVDQYKCRLALDRKPPQFVDHPQCPFDVWVVKPASEDPAPFAERAALNIQRVVVTSSMDHPVGQLFAAFEAARLQKHHPLLLERCGLISHHVYEPNDFSSELHTAGSRLLPPPGPGLALANF